MLHKRYGVFFKRAILIPLNFRSSTRTRTLKHPVLMCTSEIFFLHSVSLLVQAQSSLPMHMVHFVSIDEGARTKNSTTPNNRATHRAKGHPRKPLQSELCTSVHVRKGNIHARTYVHTQRTLLADAASGPSSAPNPDKSDTVRSENLWDTFPSIHTPLSVRTSHTRVAAVIALAAVPLISVF
jgi:hypothetical protein